MFGYLDGISQPAISGFNTPLPGQTVVDEGVILTGGLNGSWDLAAGQRCCLTLISLDGVARPADGWMTGKRSAVRG